SVESRPATSKCGDYKYLNSTILGDGFGGAATVYPSQAKKLTASLRHKISKLESPIPLTFRMLPTSQKTSSYYTPHSTPLYLPTTSRYQFPGRYPPPPLPTSAASLAPSSPHTYSNTTLPSPSKL